MSKPMTKKKKSNLSSDDKSKLWEIFDNEYTDSPIECVYENTTNHEICGKCNSTLVIMEDGFPTCTNTDCGLMYTNTLDYSPEWRFFGAEDKNANDPTRCGNPINPLLEQSSYGASREIVV